MFIGHFALGFAAKRAAPRVSLAVLFGAAQFADLLWPFLLAAGIEQVRIDPGNTAFTPLEFVSYPYSHSLATLTAWGLAFGYVFMTMRTKKGPSVQKGPYPFFEADKRKRGTAPFGDLRPLFLTALVVSHWMLDFLTHRPDMPLYPGGPKVGLGLWNSVPATVAVEVGMYAVALLIYARTTRARDRVGRWGFIGLAALLVVIYAGNIVGPPPPSVTAIWAVGIIGGALLLALSWWVDAHRGNCTRP